MNSTFTIDTDEYYPVLSEAVQKIGTRTLLEGVMPKLTKTANFKATPMKNIFSSLLLAYW